MSTAAPAASTTLAAAALDAATEAEALDHHALFALGLDQVRALASRTWTDHNVHDPGITALELLAYALTDLSYRATFPVADLLAAPEDNEASMRGQFFTARQILPSAPLTVADYRRLLIDLPGIKNAWITPAAQTLYADTVRGELQRLPPPSMDGFRRVDLRGLYAVRVEYMDGLAAGQRTEAMGRVRAVLHANRGLCEDFVDFAPVAEQPFILCGEVDVQPGADLARVQAEILFAVQQYLSPPVLQYTLAEMAARAHPDGRPYGMEDVFDGPPLEHGFIDAAELAAAELRTEIRLSDVVSLVMDVPGVVAVRELVVQPLPPASPAASPWRVPVNAGEKPTLARDASRLVFYKRHMPFTVQPAAWQPLWDALAAQAVARVETPRAEDLPIPLGRWRDPAAYHSFQNHFPALYGLGEAGLPGGADARRERLAYQLKGYLLFFDQLMADFMAQLAHVPHLFSTDPDLARTWFHQPVTSFTGWRRLYRGAEVAGALEAGLDDEDAMVERRNRFLDHLIARHGERFHELAEVMRTEFGMPARAMIAPKCAFLADCPELGRRRGMAYDYALQDEASLWNSDNVSGLERRLSALLGIPIATRRNLSDVAYDLYAEVDATPDDEFRFRVRHPVSSKILLSSSTRYATRAAARDEMRRAIRFASTDGGYQRRRVNGGTGDRWYFNVVDDAGEVLARRIEYFPSEGQMDAAIAALTEHLRTAYSEESMYVVEGILLRPEQPTDPLLPICADPGCTDCADADPYSYRIHVILPAYAGRFQDMEFRRWAEQVVREETPAHVQPRVCWISRDAMAELETLYRAWISLRAGRPVANRAALLQRFADALYGVRNVYPTQRLASCQAPEKFVLGHTRRWAPRNEPPTRSSTAMPPVLNERSLDEVTTGYTLFEADQVLTHHQLNSVAGYADDQIRLTRVRLSGVGIASGLQASLAGATVRVTGGVGVTTDGDLLALDADTVFDRWRPYDAGFPAYPPLYVGGNVSGAMHRAWELVPAGTPGSPGRPLGEFAGATGTALGTLAAVLLMESHRQDDDLCSGTDCDNLGARAVNTRRLLLVEPAALPALRGGQATAADAFAQLPEIGADRPVLGTGIGSLAALSTAYRAACAGIHDRLVAVLPRIHTHAGAVLGPVVAAGSAAAWITRLTAVRTDYAGSRLGIQYYYDFLKDVVDTYNELREALFADDTWSTPPITTFAKHLLLGELTPSAGAADNRTGWYPSPVTSPTARGVEQARFLVQRLDALVNRFSAGTDASLAVRVTPSMAEDRPLDDRAIPFYYTPGGADPIRRRWSWRLARRGAADTAYSYHASTYAPAGSPAANPLAFQVARSTFFRVEGVVGKPVGTALDAVQDLIRDRNLPFAVRAVLVGTRRDRVHRRRGRRTQLHHLHQIVRADTTARLADVETFSASYGAQAVAAAASANVLLPSQSAERNLLLAAGTTTRAAVAQHAGNARAITGGSYAQYRLGADTLQLEIADTIQAGATLTHDAGIVLETGFISPMDTLGTGQASWLPLIDGLLVWQEGREDDRYFFSNFVAEHPQVEHLGGVVRGGTLVLLHTEDGVVVGEAMLPYAWLEAPVDEDEPELEVERAVPPLVAQPPVRWMPTREWTWQQEWTFREPEINVLAQARDDINQWLQTETTRIQTQLEWQQRFMQQSNMDFVKEVGQTYNAVLGNSWSYAGAKYREPADGFAGIRDPGFAYEDATLGKLADATRKAAESLELFKQAGLGVDESGMVRVNSMMEGLVFLVEATAGYIGHKGGEVAAGTDSARAFEQVEFGLEALRGTRAFSLAQDSLKSVAEQARSSRFRAELARIVTG